MQCQATPRHIIIGSSIRSQRIVQKHQKRSRTAAVQWRVRAEVQQQEAAAAATAAAAGDQSNGEERVPPGCARYTVKIPKPLGMVLEEGPGSRGVYVVEVFPEGNAARLAPEISVGDELIATSGLTYTTQQTYQDNVVQGGETYVRLNVRNNDFKTVMAAIGSHPAGREVKLEFQRCDA